MASRKIKVAFVVPDNRDEFQDFQRPLPWFGPAPDTLLEGFAELPDLEVHIISKLRAPAPAPERLASNIFFHPIYVRHFGRFRTLYAGVFPAVRREVARLQPDIVHGQGSERWAALASTLTSKPSVITLHGIMSKIARVERRPFFSFNGITAWMERRALPRTGGVICLSRHAQAEVRGFNGRTWVIPNPISDSFFDLPRQPASPPEILHVANIYSLKNQVGLIKALDPLAGKTPFILRLFGKLIGDESAREVTKLAQSRPWVRLEGFAKGQTLLDALSRATLLALPSFEENCPMSILEAMAIGIPVAASNAGGIPDLVRDGETGFLFNPHDGASIRTAIEKILVNAELAKRLGAAGKARAEKEFRPRVIAQRHLDVYREILAEADVH